MFIPVAFNIRASMGWRADGVNKMKKFFAGAVSVVALLAAAPSMAADLGARFRRRRRLLDHAAVADGHGAAGDRRRHGRPDDGRLDRDQRRDGGGEHDAVERLEVDESAQHDCEFVCGVGAVGADADLVLVDMARSATIRDED